MCVRYKKYLTLNTQTYLHLECELLSRIYRRKVSMYLIFDCLSFYV